MLLNDVFSDIERPIKIKGIATNSQDVKSEYVFVSLSGDEQEQKKEIKEAVKNGAIAIVGKVNLTLKKEVEYIKVRNPHKTLAILAAEWNKRPADKITLLGVTGTSGKTTTATMLYNILESAGKKVEILTTKPNPLELHNSLKKAHEKEVEFVILETSAEYIDKDYIHTLNFEAAVLTNISSKQNRKKIRKSYVNTKAKLADQSKILFANKDDDSYSYLVQKGPKIRPYSTKKIKLDKKVKAHLDKYLPGEYNMANYASAKVLARHLGLTGKQINEGIKTIKDLDGRFDQYSTYDGKTVVIDCAKIPNSLDKFLLALKNKYGKICIVLGAEGSSSKRTRAALGKIAANYCDHIVLTSKDPESENPTKIMHDIKKGIPKSYPSDNIFEVTDRSEAIAFGISELLDACDVVAVTGKGQEKFMDYGKHTQEWSDEKEVLDSIKIRKQDIEFIKSLKVSKDTRTINKGEYYVPVDGTKYGGTLDGHKFIPEAKKKGAEGIIEEDELYYLTKKKLDLIKPIVVGITGSMGKTTLKEVVGTVLREKYKVLVSPGNLNTSLGLSLTVINELTDDHEVFVAEMGMDRLGEIAETCEVIQPDISIITVINEAHLEKLGSLNNIIKAKGEILAGTKEQGIGILNRDDKNSMKLKNTGKCKKEFFSAKTLKTSLKNTKLLGEHSKVTAAAAEKIAQALELTAVEIKRGLAKVEHPKGRLRLLEGINGAHLIDDTYNSNPDSAKAALDVLETFNGKKKVAILGDMLELGPLEDEGHIEVLEHINKLHIDLLITVGPRMIKALDKVLLPKTEIVSTLNYEAANNYIKDTLKLSKDDVVLLKGSQGIRVELITETLLRNPDKAKVLLVRQSTAWKTPSN